MFNKKGIAEQAFEQAETFGTLNPLGAIIALVILAIACAIFLYFYKQFKHMNKRVASNGHSRDEIKIVHERVDRANVKIDAMANDMAKEIAILRADVSYIKGRLDNAFQKN